jgi:hypothetical protein
MSLFKRLEGVFFNPRPTFEAVAEKPVWVDMLVLLLVALIAYSFIVAPYMQTDNSRLMKENEAKLKQRFGEERYQTMIQPPTQARKIVQSLVIVPAFFVIALLIQALVLLIMGRFMSTEGNYKQVFASLVHAGGVNILLGNAVRLILVLTKKSVMQTSTSLALLFPRLEVTSTAYVALAQVDFFQLWMFGILAYGLSAVFKVDLKKSLVVSYVFWLLKAVVNFGIGMWGISFLR